DVPIDREAETLADGRVDGALILRDEDDAIGAELAKQNFPCVRFFSRSNDHTPYVDADNEAGGKMATQHLLDLGHRRIVFVHGPVHSSSSNDRMAGYRKALDQAGIKPRTEWELEIPSAISDISALRELMQTPDRPTALFVWSDDVALACMTMLHDLRLSVPKDVSVIGFDSLEVCDRSVPPLTSVRQPVFEMAQAATKQLVSLIRGEEIADRQVLFPLQLDLRASTAPCPNPKISR
ncbi:MAG: substrate-binding domain-containing protein, partial [Chlorobia bacterium]|nr:substrate-binding domain-containing protein [Fimbriimonadaceae bacterium]